ncbi:UNVERIFIED_CONTAM: putative integral membrane protein [Acetivibrio alkalicellulosi]
MWTREMLKTRAKSVLRDSYWKAFLVSLVILIVGGDGSSPGFSWNFGNSGGHPDQFYNVGNEFLPFIILTILGIFTIIIMFALAFRIFLGYPLEVGGRCYFSKSAQDDVNMNYLGFGFSKGRYGDIVKTMLWKGFLNFLWYLLFIIPGIVKGYAYSMVPYILSDNPNIGYRRAVELSNRMTQGQKLEMFILDLSFIGWYLLGILALCVGVLFVNPYYNATQAELYLVLRRNALENGLCTYEELKLDPRLDLESDIF